MTIFNIFLKNIKASFFIQKILVLIVYYIIHLLTFSLLPIIGGKEFTLKQIMALDNKSTLLGCITNLLTPGLYLKSIGFNHNIQVMWILNLLMLEIILIKLIKILLTILTLWSIRVFMAQFIWYLFNVDILDYILSFIPDNSREYIYSILNNWFLIPVLGTSLVIMEEIPSLLNDVKSVNTNIYETTKPNESSVFTQISNFVNPIKDIPLEDIPINPLKTSYESIVEGESFYNKYRYYIIGGGIILTIFGVLFWFYGDSFKPGAEELFSDDSVNKFSNPFTSVLNYFFPKKSNNLENLPDLEILDKSSILYHIKQYSINRDFLDSNFQRAILSFKSRGDLLLYLNDHIHDIQTNIAATHMKGLIGMEYTLSYYKWNFHNAFTGMIGSGYGAIDSNHAAECSRVLAAILWNSGGTTSWDLKLDVIETLNFIKFSELAIPNFPQLIINQNLLSGYHYFNMFHQIDLEKGLIYLENILNDIVNVNGLNSKK